MNKINFISRIILMGAIICGGFAVTLGFAVVPAFATTNCSANGASNLSLNWNYGSPGGTASVTITNNSSSCAYTLNFVSYKMYDASLTTQTLFDSTSGTIAHNSSMTLYVSLPSCNYQVDVVQGAVLTTNPNYGPTGYFIAGKQLTNGSYCAMTTPPPPTATCSASPLSVNTGDTVTWTVSPAGGNGTFSYSWSGTDSLSGTSQSIQKTYSTSGTKNGSVVVTSNGQSVTANCSTTVVPPTQPPTLIGFCEASPGSSQPGQVITWNAFPYGGNGTYTYSWSGDEGLTGTSQSENITYSTDGSKNAAVVITSGSQSITENCSAYMYQAPPMSNPLTGYCIASPSSVPVGQTITWQAVPSGGTGSYTYSWSGANISGTSQTVQTSYGSAGTQSATVVITSGTSTITSQCNANIYQNTNVNNQPISVSCYANPSSINVNQYINWTATASGGNNGSYTYSWTGSNSLNGYGSTVQGYYTTPGQAYAMVTVTSGSQTGYATCYGYVNQQYNQYIPPTNNQALSVTCSANPSSAYIGDTVNWTANAYGGSGSYTYSWTGTNIYNNNNNYNNGYYNNSNSMITQTYNTAGEQQATVTVYSNGQSASQTCYVYVSQRPGQIVYNTPPTGGGVYLNQVPYTGIGSNIAIGAFILAVLGWSGAMGYAIVKRKAEQELA